MESTLNPWYKLFELGGGDLINWLVLPPIFDDDVLEMVAFLLDMHCMPNESFRFLKIIEVSCKHKVYFDVDSRFSERYGL